MKLEFEFDFETVTRVLIIIVVLLTAASLAGQFSTYFLGDGHLLGFVPEFNLDREMNIPTWFSSFMFFFCGGFVMAVGKSFRSGKRPDREEAMEGVSGRFWRPVCR